MSASAVLFDLDGTLLDTLEDLADSMNAALNAEGYPPHPIDDYRMFIGDGVRILAERVLPTTARSDSSAVDRLAERYLGIYGANWNHRSAPYPGIPELLDHLSASGVGMAVCSNKPESFTLHCVSALLARWRFGAVIGHGPAFPRKPDPASALHIAASLGVEPAGCLFLGDSGVDMETARRAGMTPVGVLWGFRGAAELRAAGAETLIASPAEALSLLPAA